MSQEKQSRARLPRLMIALASDEDGNAIRVTLESYLHFANELAFDLEDLVEDHAPRRRGGERRSSGSKFGTAAL